jgi:plastocyanin
MGGLAGMGGMPGMGGMAGMAPEGAGATQEVKDPPRKIRNVRALLVTDKGLLDSGLIAVSDYLALSPELSDTEGWVRLVVPLADFKPVRERTSASLDQVALFGDAKGEFYVGAMRLVQEDQPLKADAGPDRVVKVGQEVTFSAANQAGTAKARYSWDFDDIVEGIAEDALGQRATYTFEEAGFYKVTLTVTDPDAKRMPRVDRVNVTVQ